MSRRAQFASLLSNLQIPPMLDTLWGSSRLTVLAYHRIIDIDGADFDFFEPNVSATPAMFEQQMAYVNQHFSVVSLDQVLRFLWHQEPLPPRPLLITFDDGYLDNYQNARPILKKYGFPAVIFLMTSRMDNPHQRAWWDQCAYVFHHTQASEATLPTLGKVTLGQGIHRRPHRDAVMRYLKTIPEAEKLTTINQLAAQLGVAPPQDSPIFMTWDQVRDIIADGISCQPHTVNHPILTRINRDSLFDELSQSRDIIAEKTGQAITAFAYPNGTTADYNQEAIQILQQLDYQVAFTLTPGPMRASAARKHPYEIRRVYLGQRDTFEMFKLKVMGLPVLTDPDSYQSYVG